VTTSGLPIQPNHLAQWNAWKASPPPRIVCLRKGYRFWYAVLIAACVIVPSLWLKFPIVEWSANPAKLVMNSDSWSAIQFIALLLIFLLIAFRALIRNRRLVTSGEISIGKVTGVRLGRKGTRPVITYEFIDISGRLIIASSPDYTRSFSPGMVIPIFYNPESPGKDQVALCAAVYEVCDLREPNKSNLSPG
jgi:hypothetical protein